MGSIKWTPIAAVVWSFIAAYTLYSDETDKGVVAGLIAVCFAVLSLNEK